MRISTSDCNIKMELNNNLTEARCHIIHIPSGADGFSETKIDEADMEASEDPFKDAIALEESTLMRAIDTITKNNLFIDWHNKQYPAVEKVSVENTNHLREYTISNGSVNEIYFSDEDLEIGETIDGFKIVEKTIEGVETVKNGPWRIIK